jgi:hypothetical protein
LPRYEFARGESSLRQIDSDDLCYGLLSTATDLRCEADGTP